MCLNKKIVILACFSLFFMSFAMGQTSTVRFTYDENGNRIERRVFVERMEQDENLMEQVVVDTINSFFTTLDKTTRLVFSVYPNPTEEKVTVICSCELPSAGRILLFSSLGVLLEERSLSKIESFDLSHRSSGIYLLKIFHGEKTHVWRVVKQ